MKYVLSTCGGCGSGCGIILYEGDRIIKGVAPVRNHPSSQGNLCIKGWNIHQSINSSERLRKPLIKNNGSFKEVTWEEALDFASKRMKNIIESEGGKGIGVIGSQKITNEENYALMKLSRSVLRTNNIDQCGVFNCFSLQNEPYNIFQGESLYDSIDNLNEDDLILLVGSDITKDNPQVSTYILRAIRRGAKILIINPRTVKFGLFSHIYLKHIPGSEVSLLNGLLRIILENKESEKELYNSLELYNK